eukprot:4626009-Pleurochrysis_carterae.AAC.1
MYAAFTGTKLIPQPLTSNASGPSRFGRQAWQIGRQEAFIRFALFSRAFLILSTCCLLLKTFSGKGPGQRGSL